MAYFSFLRSIKRGKKIKGEEELSQQLKENKIIFAKWERGTEG